MVGLFADENFPLPVVRALREFGIAVVTIQEIGMGDRAITDEDVLKLAADRNLAVVTLNRKDFIKLHQANPDHSGIIVCTFDRDFAGQARRIHEAVSQFPTLARQLVRITRA